MRMNSFDALIWRSGVDNRLRHNIALFVTLDHTPKWTRFVLAHERATTLIPRLRQHAVEPTSPLRLPAWQEDEQFELGYHLRRVAVPAPGTLREALDVARDFAQVPLDRSRPPWEALLIENSASEHSYYVLKLHHALADGVSLVRWLSTAFITDEKYAEADDQVGQPDLVQSSHTSDKQVGDRFIGLVDRFGLSRLPDWCRSAKSVGPRILPTCFALARSLARPGAALAGTPVFGSSSRKWHYVSHAVSLHDLKAAAKATKSTVNDAFLAGVLGAFAWYQDTHGTVANRLSLGMSVNLRDEAQAINGGNGFMIVKFVVPIGDNPAERVQLARGASRQAVNEADPTSGAVFQALASRLPKGGVVRLAGSSAGAVDFQVTNVQGMQRYGYLAGAKVTGVYAFAPLTGCAATISIWSHGDTCCIAVNLDPEAVKDVDLFRRCLQQGFDAVIGLQGDPGAEREFSP